MKIRFKINVFRLEVENDRIRRSLAKEAAESMEDQELMKIAITKKSFSQ